MTDREQARQDIKRRLNSYRDLEDERCQILDELHRLETLMAAPSGSNWDGMPRGSDVSNPVENMAHRHIKLEQLYRTKLADLTAAQKDIEHLVEGLEPTERCLARFRYINGLRWEDVCDKMNYSWRQTHRIHGRLLDKLVDAELAKA